MIRGRKEKYKKIHLASPKKKYKMQSLGLAVLFGAGEWSGSKFGLPGPKFYGERKSGFGSVGSARVRALTDIFTFGM